MGGSLSLNRKGSVGSPGKTSSISDSEGAFETPEAESPESPGVVKLLDQVDVSNRTVPPDATNHFLDTNFNRDTGSVSPEGVDSLNNLIDSSFGPKQNLNLTLGGRPGAGAPPQPQALRPPSLSVFSPLNQPDPSEVDNEAPVSRLVFDVDAGPGRDARLDPDFLNGNSNSDTAPSHAKQTGETNGAIITNAAEVKQSQPMRKDSCGQGGDHATDEEKLANNVVGVKPDKDENIPDCQVTSKPDDSDSCSVHKDSSKLKKESGVRDVEKTGSQGLDSICISESEKQAVLALIREEIVTKEAEANDWRKKFEDSRQEVTDMRKVVAEYETTIAQMIEDEQHLKLSSQRALHSLTLEKEAAVADLNSVERSLSDMFRRYENMKSTLEGFKKNEEMLKKCAQEYLARIKQEEQRYQTLKLHAEEKLDKANEEIAQVRSKASSENTALTAGLRMEQMKNESLEQALQQKNQEIEELTKICDELIAKMGKVD